MCAGAARVGGKSNNNKSIVIKMQLRHYLLYFLTYKNILVHVCVCVWAAEENGSTQSHSNTLTCTLESVVYWYALRTR